MKLFEYLTSAVRFFSQDETFRRIVFYSEGGNYWVHLQGIVFEMLEKTDLKIAYVSSSRDDPGVAVSHERFRSFVIGDGAIRNWFFENLKCDLMVMTMPDLNQYQVKRSHHPVRYVYVQHSLVSLHMVYRPGAFDHFDTICCCGPHHVKEVRAMEAQRSLPRKDVLEHGYGRLDAILANACEHLAAPPPPIHILVAPSWGPHGLIESGHGESVVEQLLNAGHKVTFRPHPMTKGINPDALDRIIARFDENPLFDYEGSVAGQASLHASHVMISDWSGAALDYAFGLGKPVVFVDVERKINNPDYETLGITPFEVSIRDKIGVIVSPAEMATLDINSVLEQYRPAPTTESVFNLGQSDKVAVDYLLSVLNRA